jgi:TetR/AcrR family transcriptional repressor of nem operon
LAVAAFERHWDNKRVMLDSIFSPQVPPLQRFEKYCQVIIEGQLEKYRTFGKMAGCPFCSVGCELSTQDENIRIKVEQITERMEKYVVSAVQDLRREGIIDHCDPVELAGEICSYITGALMQAKIDNRPRHVENLKHGVMRLLGVKEHSAVAI